MAFNPPYLPIPYKQTKPTGPFNETWSILIFRAKLTHSTRRTRSDNYNAARLDPVTEISSHVDNFP